MTDTSEFDYELPAERVAQRPPVRRDGARLLHLVPGGDLEDLAFVDLPRLLRPGDLLVANETRVRAARLRGRRPGGGEVELLVLGRIDRPGATHACLVRPARRLPPGSRLEVGEGLSAAVGDRLPGHPGARAVLLESAGDVDEAIERAGSVPLPPYIRARLDDPERYQTVFSGGAPARSAAAPTAGLHFTPAVLDALARRDVELARVRLEVGLGTFSPIRSATVEGHVMHEETYSLPVEAAEAVARARARGGRVVAVGTTSVRVLESRARPAGLVEAGEGTTGLYLRPGAGPSVVDGLLTNFHAPRSSLLVLLASLVGPRWRAAYDHALRAGYRFLSFGDCMLGWREAG